MTDLEAPQAGSRARLLVTVLLLVAVAAGLVLAATQLRRDDEPSGPTARDVVEAVLADEPDAAVVLPVEPPGGYRLAFGDTATSGSGAPLVAWAFQPPVERPDSAVVQICVAPPGRCAVPGSATSVRDVAGLADDAEAAVIPYGTPDTARAALDLWADTELTTEWQDLAWLDEPAAPRP